MGIKQINNILNFDSSKYKRFNIIHVHICTDTTTVLIIISSGYPIPSNNHIQITEEEKTIKHHFQKQLQTTAYKQGVSDMASTSRTWTLMTTKNGS